MTGVTKDVENYISKCNFVRKIKSEDENVSHITPEKPFEKCSLDIVGPLPITNEGNKYILIFQDSLTKFSKAIPVENQEASTHLSQK